MVFNSLTYAIFVLVIFLFYWLVAKNNQKAQNILLLIASYYFYAQWDYSFPLLLLFSTLVNFFTGICIRKSKEAGIRRFWLYFGIIINLGVLGIFKYVGLWFDTLLGIDPNLSLHNNGLMISNIVLPVGISFYTFCGLSYIIDIFQNKISPTRNYIEYSVFISFFPALTAGPIGRASHLLPQIQKTRKFDYEKSVDGLKQILWGLFKKIVIADGCAEYANMIFNNSADFSGSTLVLGAILFSFQIYADFSGYSDIALGSARLFGIELLQNFAFPYFSKNIAEFWRRWHISLSSWLRDYVFYPLERRRLPLFGQSINILIIFLLTGLWHGGNWTFILWGALNGAYFLLFQLTNKYRNKPNNSTPENRLNTIKELLNIGLTFSLTTFAWIFFRAENLNHAFEYILGIISWSLFTFPEIMPIKILVLIFTFMLFEWQGKEQKYAIAQFARNWPKPFRWTFYYAIIFLIFYFSGSQQVFIYAQF